MVNARLILSKIPVKWAFLGLIRGLKIEIAMNLKAISRSVGDSPPEKESKEIPFAIRSGEV